MPYYDNSNLLESYFFLCNRDDGRLTRGRPRDYPVLHELGQVSVLLLILLLFLIWTLSFPPAYALPILSVLILNGVSKKLNFED